ncbi:Camphene synthase [Kitasatospora sp. NPDC096077]|uniref:terpene synthase family protein n=1 Tax=Kitasatospora sp. NPDC096077 TaxID=3155544 RepID=UPI00331802A9
MSPLNGPTGIGTSAARRFAPHVRVADAACDIASLRLDCPPPRREDPLLAARINERLLNWADQVGLYHGQLERVRAADFGNLAVLCYPESDDLDLLTVPARCALAIWALDDHYCDDPSLGAVPALTGTRLATASATLDRVRLPARYEERFEHATRTDPVLIGLRSAVGHLAAITSPIQLDRTRHSLLTLFSALAQEASWRAARHQPRVWEYLVNRQANSFLPCLTVIDALGTYRLPPADWADPRVRQAVGTAALASCVANDIYSLDVENHAAGQDFNLPRAVAEEHSCTAQEALRISADLHNELMDRFHARSEELAAGAGPELRRFLDGVLAWCAGSLAWHRSSPRYRSGRVPGAAIHPEDRT